MELQLQLYAFLLILYVFFLILFLFVGIIYSLVRMLKIYFDNIIFQGQKSGGISVVWYELLSRIIDMHKYQLRFMDNGIGNNMYRRMLDLSSYTVDKDGLYPLSSLLPVSVQEKQPFIFHSSYYRYCNNPKAINVTTVHDFTYEYYRKGLAKYKHCWQKYRAIRNSNIIVCISENTKKDLLRFLPDIDENKIKVIYNGVSDDYYVLDDKQKTINIPFGKRSYLVFVGSRAGYKNFDFVMKTMSKTHYNLVIVGSKLTDKEEKELRRYMPKERFYSTGFLSNKDLNVLYNNAAALVYPSSYEGFGIPVLEAQRAGCPVIAYNSSSIPEVIGNTPLLMNELTEEEFLNKISLLSDKHLMDMVINDGIKNSKRFSWEKMYQEYMKIYNEALE